MKQKIETEYYKRAVLGLLRRQCDTMDAIAADMESVVICVRTIMAEQAAQNSPDDSRTLRLPNILTPAGG